MKTGKFATILIMMIVSFQMSGAPGTSSDKLATKPNQVKTAPEGFSLSFDSTNVIGGAKATGTITLSTKPLPSRLAVSLSSSDPRVLSVPAEVVIFPLKLSANFPISTRPVAMPTVITVSASLAADTRTASILIAPPAVAAVTLSPATVIGGIPVNGLVTLTGFAAATGATVTLASNQSAATVPESIQVPGGSSQGTFSIRTKSVAAATNATISASAGGTVKTAQIVVTPSPTTSSGGAASVDTAIASFGNCMTRSDFDASVPGTATTFSTLAGQSTTQGMCYVCHSSGAGGAFLSPNGDDMFRNNRIRPYILKLAMPSQKSDGTYTIVASNRCRDHGGDPGTHPRYSLSTTVQAAIEQYFSRTLARFSANANGCRSTQSN